ncbi:MAG TPA: carboxylating nicotinate-nucleotide diphosphorylase [Tahibacter sp.]|uniref:carboxylating nicotinate-nucleotide diphosphorylase n=1 Tax=Tahibacter sp. TaxID=2056211 RepID=UPI002C25280A|nr:carboxylating nicotinate-nucleotide diphosphorylase [Tahibacter sp.]HSX61089.1 carboxylating nicotinate-nucleotide diphosphorylase [Tahibacter sp.]
MRFDPPPTALVLADVRRALAEDLGSGDATADLLPADATARARVLTRETAILCGQAWFELCFRELDRDMSIVWHAADGDRLTADQVFVELHGNARALVSAERSALNFIQTLSGTATATAAHVAVVAGTRTRILDTRKTLPGLRVAQKYAVRCGGGANHRIGLFDALLIKENHIAAAGSLTAAVAAARSHHPALLLEVEVETFDELREALAAGVDRVMLDEFSDADLARAVVEVAGRAEIEVSGGVDLQRLAAIAASGVDFISIGALTKHVRAIDLSMRVSLES